MMPRDNPVWTGKSVRSTSVRLFQRSARALSGREYGSSCARDSAIYRSSWRVAGGKRKSRVTLARRAADSGVTSCHVGWRFAEQRQAATHRLSRFHVYRTDSARWLLIGTSAIYTPRRTRFEIHLGSVVMWQHATTHRATRCRTLRSAFDLACTRAADLCEKSCREVRSF